MCVSAPHCRRGGDRPARPRPVPLSRLDDLPHVRATGERGAASRRAVPEHDAGVVLHAQALIDEPLRCPRLGLATAPCAHVETGERLWAHADGERLLGCLATHVVICSLAYYHTTPRAAGSIESRNGDQHQAAWRGGYARLAQRGERTGRARQLSHALRRAGARAVHGRRPRPRRGSGRTRRPDRPSRRVPVHARHPPHDVPRAAVDDAPVRGLRHAARRPTSASTTCSRRARRGCRRRSTCRR